MLKYKYIFHIKYSLRRQFYQTALGNCYGLNLPKYDCSSKNTLVVSFIIIFGTRSLHMGLHT